MAEKLTQEAIEQAQEVTADDVLDAEALLEELAQLSPLAYDQCRQDKAKLLKIRVSTLDAEVEARRAKTRRSTPSLSQMPRRPLSLGRMRWTAQPF